MSRDRLPLLDALRCIASVAVVWHHLRGSYLFGAALGVPLFLVLMVALGARSSASTPFADVARAKAQRLLVPWLRWSLVYVALAVVTELAHGHGPTAGLDPRMLLYGGHGALWFLPCAFVVVLAARALRGALVHVPMAAFVASAVAVSWVTERWHLAAPLGMPLGAWLRAAPALPWGLALARVSLEPEGRGRGTTLALVAAAAIGAVLLPPGPTGGGEPLLRFALAVPLACLGLAWRPAVPRSVQALSTLTFGVYLVHPLLAKAFATVFEVARWPGALHLAAVWLTSAAAVLALRRLPVQLTECWSVRPPARRLALPNREARRAA